MSASAGPADGASAGPLRAEMGWLRTEDGSALLPVTVALAPLPADPAHMPDLLAAMDAVAALQVGGVRMRVRLSPWNFCFDPAALSPWPSGAAAGISDAFAAMLRSVAEHAARRRLLVQCVVFDSRALSPGAGSGWARNPFNAANGGPVPAAQPAGFYHLVRPSDAAPPVPTSAGAAAGGAQELLDGYVAALVHCLDGLANVTWQIVGGLDGADPVRVGFVSHFARLVRAVDPLGQPITFSTEMLGRSDAVLHRLAAIDAIDVRAPSVAADSSMAAELYDTVVRLAATGKPALVEPNITSAPATATPDARAALWRAFAAGGGPAADLRAGVTPPRSDWLRAFARTVGAMRLDGLQPTTVAVWDEDVKAVACASDSNALAYLTAASATQAGAIEVALRAGVWSGSWVDPSTGAASGDPVRIEATRGGLTRIGYPAFAEDLALQLTAPDK